MEKFKGKKLQVKNKYTTLLLKKRRYRILVFIFSFVLIISLLVILFGGKFKLQMKDNARKQLMEEIVSIINKQYLEDGSYPSSILFSKHEALLCKDVDCRITQSIKIGKLAKSISGADIRTTTDATKYGYFPIEDGYQLGYCDENGNIEDYGNSNKPPLLICN